MQRGEVWWAALPPPIGRRPVVLLSRNAAYDARTAITVAPVTRTIRHIPTEVPLDEADGLSSACVANVDDIDTIPRAYLKERIATLSRAKMLAVNRAVIYALDLAGQ